MKHRVKIMRTATFLMVSIAALGACTEEEDMSSGKADEGLEIVGGRVVTADGKPLSGLSDIYVYDHTVYANADPAEALVSATLDDGKFVLRGEQQKEYHVVVRDFWLGDSLEYRDVFKTWLAPSDGAVPVLKVRWRVWDMQFRFHRGQYTLTEGYPVLAVYGGRRAPEVIPGLFPWQFPSDSDPSIIVVSELTEGKYYVNAVQSVPLPLCDGRGNKVDVPMLIEVNSTTASAPIDIYLPIDDTDDGCNYTVN